MADLNFVSHFESSDRSSRNGKLKNGLTLPSSKKKHISLSDIIAATIGDEARSCDTLYIQNLDHVTEKCQYTSNINTENSNNACDAFDSRFNIEENSLQGNNKDVSFSTDFTTKVGFDTNMDFLSSLFVPEESTTEPEYHSTHQSNGVSQNKDVPTSEKEQSTQSANTSYDSDLEDSMHFVEPDEGTSFQNEADDNCTYFEPMAKKLRVCLNDSSSCPFPITSRDFSDGNQTLISLFNDEHQEPFHKMNGIARARSFSGNIKPKLSRQCGKLNLHHQNKQKTATFGRTRSFSEACNRDSLTSMSDSYFNTSLTSLLDESSENIPLSTNPFFSDLKSLLISDCNSTDCPKTLFETLSNKPPQDVYARERNLQSKFSSLQGKYPDEVRELSSFYRQQSAEVETERLKEIHDDNVPKSYRNHLNSYYDNQLHMIMERVEKSLSLLLKAKREIITINRPFKSRPLLSRRAVKMMEEWYSRNYEHPYPGPTAVEALAKAGEITNEQVKKWFANKRNRNKNTKPVPEIANIKRKRQFSARW